MKRSVPLRRRRPLPKRGKRGKRFRGYERDERYRRFVREHGCVLAGRHECWGLIEFCHVVSRGAGGVDLGNGWPGCSHAHREQHAIGIRSFERRYGLDLTRLARTLHAAYESEF